MINTCLKLKIITPFLIPLLCLPGKTIQHIRPGNDPDEIESSYLVRRAGIPPEINADWNHEIWDNTKPLRLDNYMGEKPSHFPETMVKLRYDEGNIYVIFSVKDKYVKAVAKETHGHVYWDSCVEFFFSPGPDTERGYFNLEANCKGVFLFEYHINNGDSAAFVNLEDCRKVEIAHSLKTDVEQEIAEPLNWSLEYRIPFDVLKKYMKVDEPGPGVSWRANFYKCADKTSHPHWLTWAPVDYPRPRFHMPEYFGRLLFE